MKNPNKLKSGWLAFLFIAGFLSAVFAAGYYYSIHGSHDGRVYRDTLYVVDTISYYRPVARDSVVVRYERRSIPVVSPRLGVEDTLQHDNGIAQSSMPVVCDSMLVEFPITQKCYEGDDYRAYVSGYEPNLDSIFVFPKTTVIHERCYKPPERWRIGVTGGYGYGVLSGRFEPFVGVGIVYSFISF